MMNNHLFKRFSVGLLFLWIGLFALLPFVLVCLASVLESGDTNIFVWHFTFTNYLQLFHPIYFKIFVRSLYLSVVSCSFCFMLGYPFAYICSRMPKAVKPVLIFFLMLPFWTSTLMRVYSIIVLIRGEGWLSHLLMWLGLIHQPLHLLFTQTAVLIGLVYISLPFMILPLYANLEKFDWRLLDAARDLGAGKLRILFRVVVPITKPGIIAGVMLVLLPAMTLFYVPDVLGGAKSLLLGNLIKDQFFEAHNWPFGASISMILTILMGALLLFYWKNSSEENRQELI
ncbi:MAG: ABC transporter permease subunit [Gammaproteobacteria bacterium]|nr:ABC transporter permease subunit [Gammaproteobacteria bacterium]MBU1558434.1 ABC transporter permease subunit [Gammaproteobacteria bacterium]